MIDFGENVYLDTLDEGEHERLICWRNDPGIWRWTRQNDLITNASHGRWFEAQGKDPSIRMYTVVDRKSKEALGVCGLTSINWQNRNAEFSLYIAPGYGRKGYGRAALMTLLFHGFRNLGLKSIWGETFENNPAQELFYSIGMKHDGIRRQFYWKDGKYLDAIMISILSDEFFEKYGETSCFYPSA